MDVDVVGFAWMFGLGLGWLLLCGVGAYVSNAKHRPGAEGFILTLILGPLGVLIAALMPTEEPPKPERRYIADRKRRAEEEEEELPEVADWLNWPDRS
jgi:hypothetical protein